MNFFGSRLLGHHFDGIISFSIEVRARRLVPMESLAPMGILVSFDKKARHEASV